MSGTGAHPAPGATASLASRLGSLVHGLPRPCVLCGSWDRTGLCRQCQLRFVATRPALCPRCALPNAGGATCGRCLREPPPYHRCVAGVLYGFPWDRLITRFKFRDQPELATLLADVLADVLTDVLAQNQPTPVDLVLPVPLSASRLAERGYNQAWELARRVAARQGLPADAGLLLRLRDTPHQVGLSRSERTRNLHDAMWVEPAGRARLAGRQLALVDDVLTTGGTAVAATRALLAAGAAGVQVWVLARTPAPA